MTYKEALFAFTAFCGIAAGGILVLTPAPRAHANVPPDLDQSLEGVTHEGRFHVRMTPMVSPIPLHQIHQWTMEIVDAKGVPVDHATIAIDGGMPEHHHGLPTKPLAKPTGEPGRYEIDGAKFSMKGWWEFKLAIAANGITDSVTFDIVL